MPPGQNGVRDGNRHNKSLYVTYFLWLFGGLFGMHHYYLGRIRHGFVWWTTLGGFGFGWLGDFLKIRRYVLDANEDQAYMTQVLANMRLTGKPPFSVNRCTGMVMVAYCWGQLILGAIPPGSTLGISLHYLQVLAPLACALGVWTVGNIGRQCGTLTWPLLAAYLSYPLRYYILDDSAWLLTTSFIAAMAFDTFSKRWDTRLNRRPMRNVVTVVALCTCLYVVLFGSYLYFGPFSGLDEDDDVFTLRWWQELYYNIGEAYIFVGHYGWYELWKQFQEASDSLGDRRAYEILQLGPHSTQQEITSTWRQLSRENHPDKIKDESLRRAAQERFMEIQQAYEVLSKNKGRRTRRNKKDNFVPENPKPVPVTF